MTASTARSCRSARFSCLGIACLLWLSSCVTGGDQTSWIRIGVTTKDEVVKRYGEPDMVRMSSEGETATYSAAFSPPTVPPPMVQAVEPAPEGKMTFKPQPVVRGLGARNVAAGTQNRPGREIRIRYDTRGVVQDLHVE